MSFTKWPSIEQLHNVVKNIEKVKPLIEDSDEEKKKDFYPYNLLFEKESIKYRGKIKLHGSNAGILIQDGVVKVQSRNCFLDFDSPSGKLVKNHQNYFLDIYKKSKSKKMVIFGEFCGPRVQKGVALTQLKNDLFAIFSILLDDEIIYEPSIISKLLPEIPSNFYVIDWFTEIFELKFFDEKDLQQKAEFINEKVDKIDKEDPWVKELFNISGPGEGLVLYPIGLSSENQTLSQELFTSFVWKAKGEKHRNVKNQKSAQIKPEKAQGIENFAKMMTTDARLEQGVSEIGLDKKNTGKFVKWIVADVEKEGKAEAEESGLNLKQALGAVSKIASSWYQEQIKKSEK
eukprot:gene3258-5701_t